MRNLFYFLFFLICFSSCDLFEMYEVNFIDIENPEKAKYIINISDSKITNYKKYINNQLTEETFFYIDTIKVECITYDADNKVVFKRINILNEKMLAKITIDTAFYNDSTVVINTEYSYANGFLSRKVSETEILDSDEEKQELIYRFVYKDGNVTIVDITDQNGKCSDLYKYTEYLNLIDIDEFSNGYTGIPNKNLLFEAEWKSTCYKNDLIAKPISRYWYEFDSVGYVTKKTELFTPDYNTSFDKEVERLTTITLFEYNFVISE